MIDLRLGDCLDILPTLADGSVDAIVTDPPYGTDAPRDGYGRRSLGGPTKRIAGDSSLETLRLALMHAPRLLRPRGFAVVFCSPKRHAEAAAVVVGCGLHVFGEIVWDKKCPGLGGGIRYQHETILLCGESKPRGRSPIFSVLRHAAPRAKRVHPHEKPVGLMAALVGYASSPMDVVLDPFMGSGASGLACQDAGRRFIGIESDPTHFATAERRIALARTEAA